MDNAFVCLANWTSSEHFSSLSSSCSWSMENRNPPKHWMIRSRHTLDTCKYGHGTDESSRSPSINIGMIFVIASSAGSWLMKSMRLSESSWVPCTTLLSWSPLTLALSHLLQYSYFHTHTYLVVDNDESCSSWAAFVLVNPSALICEANVLLSLECCIVVMESCFSEKTCWVGRRQTWFLNGVGVFMKLWTAEHGNTAL